MSSPTLRYAPAAGTAYADDHRPQGLSDVQVTFAGAEDADVEALRQAAAIVARAEVADAVAGALADYDGSLRDLQKASGLDPAFVSRLARGTVKQGGTVYSLAQVALALGKKLRITIE